ncbi:MAG: hypothetical protein KC502_20220 [Myxococcales bacterium]|nr:hypothetical protein [Myxococcales bacterium]
MQRVPLSATLPWLLMAFVLTGCSNDPAASKSAAQTDAETTTDATDNADVTTADSSGADAQVTDAHPTDALTTDAGATNDVLAVDADAADTAPTDAQSIDAHALATGSAQHLLTKPADAIASYLLAGFGSAWNLFHGAHVPIGRHSDTAHVSYHTALRFRALPIPAGSHITAAKLSWHPTNEVDSSHALWINIYAEKTADSAPFDPSNPAPTQAGQGRPDQRAKTKAHIDHWLVRCNDGCTDASEYDCTQRKLDCWDRKVRFACPKDLAKLAQEVIDQPGWQAGNDMTFFLINAASKKDGKKYESSRSLTGFDPTRGPGFSPRLDITWQANKP